MNKGRYRHLLIAMLAVGLWVYKGPPGQQYGEAAMAHWTLLDFFVDQQYFTAQKYCEVFAQALKADHPHVEFRCLDPEKKPWRAQE